MAEPWTHNELCHHIRKNSNDTYSMAVVVAALYHKIYGRIPRGIGLSGAQAEFAEVVISHLPEPDKK